MNTELTVRHFSPELSRQERSIIEAKQSPVCAKMDDFFLEKNINEVVAMAYFNMRWTAPKPDEINLIVKSLCKDIRDYFSTLTINEIKIAVNQGCNKFYGEFAGLGKSVLAHFINSYMQSNERLEAIKKQVRFLKEPEIVLSEQEKKDKVKNGCLEMFERFKNGETINDIGNVNYNYLAKLGVINFTERRRSEFKKQAQEVLRKEAVLKRSSAKGINAIRDAIKEIEAVNDQNGNKVIAEAKRIALQTYFEELVIMGEELNELV